MTQIKCRGLAPKGMSPAAWKYAMQVQLSRENMNRCRERRAERAEAEKKNITLPKLKWMEIK